MSGEIVKPGAIRGIFLEVIIKFNPLLSDITYMKKTICILILLLISTILFAQEKSRREIVSELFESIEGWFGTPYVLGGNTKKGVDCSGFVVNVYKKVFDKTLPRTVQYQKSTGVPVTGRLQPGDLVFFNIDGSRVSHVGIYVFDGKFIHAASAGPEVGIIKSSLNEKYYKKRYVFARRIVNLPPYIKEEYNQVEKKKKPVQENSEQKNPEKKKEPVTELTVITGSAVTKDKITKPGRSFKKDSPFYVHLKNESSIEKRVSIEFAYQGNIIYDKSVTLIKPGQDHFETLVAGPGTYVLKVYEESGDLLYKKLVTVQ